MKIKVKKTVLTNSGKVASLLRGALDMESKIDRDKEHFWAIGLNTQNHVKYLELVVLGILDQSPIHAREIYRLAIHEGVSSVITGHNHPSGNTAPSSTDNESIRMLTEAGKVLGIKMLDHVIIGNGAGQHYSYADEGKI